MRLRRVKSRCRADCLDRPASFRRPSVGDGRTILTHAATSFARSFPAIFHPGETGYLDQVEAHRGSSGGINGDGGAGRRSSAGRRAQEGRAGQEPEDTIRGSKKSKAFPQFLLQSDLEAKGGLLRGLKGTHETVESKMLAYAEINKCRVCTQLNSNVLLPNCSHAMC